MSLTALFEEAISRKASDIHLATGQVPCLRIDGNIVRLDKPPMDPEAFNALLEPALTPESWAKIRAGLSVDRTVAYEKYNFSLVAFRASETGVAATFRIIQSEIPSLDVIGEGAQELMRQIVDLPKGLVIIAGPSGSGKNTTAYALAETINATKATRIFVIEAGPNYCFPSKMSMVTQLHIGQDFDTYERALEATRRADPDVILVDDISTGEAFRQMLILAETGHVVIANMHADSVSDALTRLSHAAGGDAEALHRALAQNLVVISIQRLFRRISGQGRVPVYEWLKTTPAVSDALLKGDMKRIVELQASDTECRSLNFALDQLIQSGNITQEMALPFRQE